MEYIKYILIVVGAVMVYGSRLILKMVKKDGDPRTVLYFKFAGLGVALVGMLKVMKFI